MKKIRISDVLLVLLMLCSGVINPLQARSGDGKSSSYESIKSDQIDNQKISKLFEKGRKLMKEKPDSALFYFDRCYKLSLLEGDLVQVGRCLEVMGKTYFVKQNYATSIEYYNKYFELDEVYWEPETVAKGHYMRGVTYLKMGEFQPAFDDMLIALELFEKQGSIVMQAKALYQMANNFFYQDNYEQSEIYYNKYIDFIDQIDTTKLTKEELRSRQPIIFKFSGLGALGSLYERQGLQEASLEYNLKALNYAKEHNLEKQIGYALHNVATNYFKQEKYDEALKHSEESLKIKKDFKDQWSIIGNYRRIAEIYMAKQQYRRAILNLDRGLRIAKELGAKQKMLELFDLYAGAHRALNEYDEAFAYLGDYRVLKDSLINETALKEMGQQLSSYEIQKRENEIAMLRNEKLLMEKNQQLGRLQKAAFVLLILLLASFGGHFYNRYRTQRSSNKLLAEKNDQIKTQNEELEKANRSRAATNALLEEKNMELEKMNEQVSLQNKALENSNEDLKQFAYVASHDLREPLRMIGSYTTLLKKRNQHLFDDSANEFMNFITDAIGRMDKLLIDLLEYSRVNTQPITYEMVEISNVFEIVAATFTQKTQEIGADIIVDTSCTPTLKASKTRMIQLFQNLVANALKFTDPERPAIVALSCKEEDDSYVFAVSDNGIGISQENQKKIFEMFRRLHTRSEYEGSGIGLSTVKKIVDKHQGEIWVESEVGVGSTFYIRVPKNIIDVSEGVMTSSEDTVSLPVN